MDNKVNVKIAVGVGYNFIIADADDVKGICIENTGMIVSVEGECYPLYKGLTFGESQKIDAIMDSGKYTERSISEHKIPQKKTYNVTVTRYGCVQVEADSESDAIKIADSMTTDEITWGDDWTATDAYCEEEGD
jgi:hypothetical protein